MYRFRSYREGGVCVCVCACVHEWGRVAGWGGGGVERECREKGGCGPPSPCSLARSPAT